MLSESKGDLKFMIRCLEKLLPEYIYDISSFEKNPLTLIEVMTLIDGITIGGHRVEDEQMIINLKSVNRTFIKNLKENYSDYNDLIKTIHTLLGVNLIDNLGRFRSTNVRISGAESYRCPSATELESIWEKGFSSILQVENKYEMCIKMFLFLVYNQFFDDCNKRTARIFVNYLAMQNNIGIFKIPCKYNREFRALLIDFFNTRGTEEISKFLYDKCFIRFKDGDYSKRQIISDRYNIWTEDEFINLYNKTFDKSITTIREEQIDEMYHRLENVSTGFMPTTSIKFGER